MIKNVTITKGRKSNVYFNVETTPEQLMKYLIRTEKSKLEAETVMRCKFGYIARKNKASNYIFEKLVGTRLRIL